MVGAVELTVNCIVVDRGAKDPLERSRAVSCIRRRSCVRARRQYAGNRNRRGSASLEVCEELA